MSSSQPSILANLQTMMNDLIIERTAKTPQVEFVALENKLTLAGRSIPENSIQFYDPLIAWTESFCASGPSQMEVHIKLSTSTRAVPNA